MILAGRLVPALVQILFALFLAWGPQQNLKRREIVFPGHKL